MGVAAALFVGGIAIEDFGELAEAAFDEEAVHAGQVRARGGDSGRTKIPGAGKRFAEGRESPDPGGAIVIGGFAAGVFVSFVTAEIRFERIVQQFAVRDDGLALTF